VKIALFAAGEVGSAALSVMLEAGCPPAAVVGEADEIAVLAERAAAAPGQAFAADDLTSSAGQARFAELGIDLGILAWWNRLIKQPLLGVPRLGYLNFHPSYLPYNRGKHYNFWTIVEETPFGVTIHWITDGIDDGDIAFQQRIEKTWEDTGESLYARARKAMVELFRDSFDRIRAGDIPRVQQPEGVGSFHFAHELEAASQIVLDDTYTARSLLNLLRARTFPPHPGAWFEEEGQRYEIELRLRRAD
jgi:methionyl-tRNA formyltransferase